MSKKIREEIWDVLVEGATDVLYLFADLTTAPVIAICRVASDFIRGEGRYKHSERGSTGSH
jgi:hypothetical protein